MKDRLILLPIRARYFILGFGLAGLHHDDLWGILFVFITALGLSLCFKGEKYD